MNDELIHYGVKGMKWGVRRQAKRDAQARAHYGEGAGNRRKLINQTVESRRKTREGYSEAFDSYAPQQNQAKHVQKAKAQRHRVDARNSVVKTARGIKNILVGNARYTTTAALTLVSLGLVMHEIGADKVLLDWGKDLYQAAKTRTRAAQIKKQFQDAGWG